VGCETESIVEQKNVAIISGANRWGVDVGVASGASGRISGGSSRLSALRLHRRHKLFKNAPTSRSVIRACLQMCFT
jgi:hypothetical protein